MAVKRDSIYLDFVNFLKFEGSDSKFKEDTIKNNGF